MQILINAMLKREEADQLSQNNVEICQRCIAKDMLNATAATAAAVPSIE